ncbi:MAG: enoyl-CoA hydratase-related protein [Microbacterium sp.]
MSRITLEIHDGRADVVLDSPERANALDLTAAEEFEAAIERVTAGAGDGSVRVLVIRANGKHFCVGGDLREFDSKGDEIGLHIARVTQALHSAIVAIDALPIPVITVVQGSVAGAGVGLAYLGDITLVAEDSVTRLAYTAVGLSPDGSSSYTLTRLLGPKLAGSLLLTNRPVTAADAVAWGLATRAVPAADLAAETDAVVGTLLAGSPESYAATKRLVRAAQTNSLVEQLAEEQRSISELAVTPYARAAIHSFASR